jgi:hypothetical protein
MTLKVMAPPSPSGTVRPRAVTMPLVRATREHKRESLFDMSVKVADLSSDIPNSGPVHQAQHDAIGLHEQTGHRRSRVFGRHLLPG